MQFQIDITGNINAFLRSANAGMDNLFTGSKRTNEELQRTADRLSSLERMASGVSELNGLFQGMTEPIINLDANLREFEAITGATAEQTALVSTAARDLAKAYGTDASQNVESFKLLLSQLSPEIAKDTNALKFMGENVNILSKSMGGDTVAAVETLTTAMNQYGVDLSDPINASEIMADMMNTMAAAAKVGSAELPEIKASLEQVGAIAKSQGVSFEELNAAIQALKPAGKAGAEGGVALRNVMMTLSKGRFMPKEVREGLSAAGVDVNKLADTSLTLSQRLQMLKPIMKDAALVGAMFGVENQLAAQALVNSTDKIDGFKTAITGTTEAESYASTVMGSLSEQMARQAARVNDMKIAFGEAVAPMIPFTNMVFSGLEGVGRMAFAINSLNKMMGGKLLSTIWGNTVGLLFNKKATDSLLSSEEKLVVGQSAASISSVLMTGALTTTSISAYGATAAVNGLSRAFYAIPVVGWIAAGITAATVAIKYLWDNSREFRSTLYGIGSAAMAVFHNIGVFVSNLWNHALKPFGEMVGKAIIAPFYVWWKVTSFVFSGIYKLSQWVVSSIGEAWHSGIQKIQTFFSDLKSFFVGVSENIHGKAVWVSGAIGSLFTGAAKYIKQGFSDMLSWFGEHFPRVTGMLTDYVVAPISGVFEWLWSYVSTGFSRLLNWFASTFPAITGFVNDWIIVPVRDAFSGLWKFLEDTVAYIKGKLMGLIEPVIKLYNKVFGTDQMVSVSAAYQEGVQQGQNAFDAEKQNANNKQTDQAQANMPQDVGTLVNTAAVNNNAPKFAASPTQGGIGAASLGSANSGGSKDAGPKNIVINNLVGALHLNVGSLDNPQDRNKIKTIVSDLLLEAINDAQLKAD